MQLLAGIGPLGLPELAIIAFIVVLVFGVGRLPEVGGAVGKGIREFRKATKDEESDATTTMQSSEPSPMSPSASVASDSTSDPVFCSECGGRNVRGARFCAHCGHGIEASVS
jgi:sec-independent protein translocase protein TatA